MAGSTVPAVVTLSATASDNVGVAGVQFLLDGQPLGPEDTLPPYTVDWKTSNAASGSHRLSARARDTSDNTATSSEITVNVANSAPPPAAVTLTLDATQRFQTFEAWIGTATGPYYPTDNGPGLPSPALLNEALDGLVYDLRLNGLRIRMRPNSELVNDNADPFQINPAGFDFTTPTVTPSGERIDWTLNFQQIILPFKQRVESRGDSLVSFIDTSLTYAGMVSHLHLAEEFAEMAEAYVQFTRSTFNFTPTYLTVANEPDAPFFFTGELVNDVIAMGQRFQMRGYPVKVQVPETIGPNSSAVQTVLSDSRARPHVGLVSFHGYDYFGSMPSSFSERNATRSLAQQYGLRTGMTEICCRGWNGSYLGQGMEMARDIYWNLTEADVSSWAAFGMLFTCSQAGCTTGSESLAPFDRNLSRLFRFPSYYALRQYSRTIRPGFVRLRLTCTGCTNDASFGLSVKGVAFVSPSAKQVAVVVNDADAARTISLANFAAGTYEISGIDPANPNSVVYSPQTILAGQPLTIQFPARAILSFVQR